MAASPPHASPRALQVYRKKVSPRAKALIAVTLVAAVAVSFLLGSYSLMLSISPADIIHLIGLQLTNPAVVDADPALRNLREALFTDRLPRIIMVMAVGAALSAAGASYQGMFRNPLVSPDLLGASTGASLGACLAMLASQPEPVVQVAAFVGGLAAVGITVWLRTFVKSDAVLGLVLAGMLVSSLFSSGMSLVKLAADTSDQLPAITYWLMGSFNAVKWKDLAFAGVPLVAGCALMLGHTWQLNALSFGDDEARAMGVNTVRTRLIVILGATLASSASVAVAGVIGWVGLVIPHFTRALVGPNYKALLPACLVIGAAYLLLIDDLSRLLLSVEIPIGILTAIVGVPFFLVIFRRTSRGW